MIVTILIFLLAAACLGIAVWILKRRWKEIRLLDPSSIQEEQERLKREALINRRFERLQSDRIQPLKKVGRRIVRSISQAYRSTYERLQAFEKLYAHAKRPFSTIAPSTRDRLQAILTEARSLVRDLKWADAERRYLEVLSLDARNLEAYKGLGLIYMKQKLYPQAKETFEFLFKSKKADDVTFAALAEIAETEDDLAKAEAMRLKAIDASPKQPFRHAELSSFYLAHNQPEKALAPAQLASDLEPNSAKYMEMCLDIALRLKDAKEARIRYDKLRLLTEDRMKFQMWKEKIELLETGE